VKYLNIVHQNHVGTVLLENPRGVGNLPYKELMEEVNSLFGIHSSSFKLYQQCVEVNQDNLHTMVGKTLTTDPLNKKIPVVNGSACPFVNVTYQKKEATLLLENPIGSNVKECTNELLSSLFGLPLQSPKQLKSDSSALEVHPMTTKPFTALYGKSTTLLL